MNSEELEQSLRSEFENYLKDVVAEMRQTMSEFKQKFDADFEKHKEILEESFREFDEKIGKDKQIEASFTDSVVEHLKLARDEGARITATAFAEAEEMEEKPEPPDFSALGHAIADISEKDSQSEILKALVNHATEYTPRGAFFIVKNEHLVGWRVFGREDHEDPQAVREVFFPVDSHTALSEAVKERRTVDSTVPDSEDDVMYRNKLGFENPDKMFAVPLIARGRGVAVLYADSGKDGDEVNIAAIETLMRVAGLTVEVLAAAPQVTPAEEAREIAEEAPPAEHEPDEALADATADYEHVEEIEEPGFEPVAAEDVSAPGPISEVEEAETPEPVTAFDTAGFDVEEPAETVAEESYEFQPIDASEVSVDAPEAPAVSEEATFEQPDSLDDSVAEYDAAMESVEPAAETVEAEHPEAEPESFETEPAWDESEVVESESFEADQSFTAESEPSVEPVTAFESYESETEESFTVVEEEVYEFESTPEATPEADFSFEAPAAEVDELEPVTEESVEGPAEEEFAFDREESFEAAPEVEEAHEAPAEAAEVEEAPEPEPAAVQTEEAAAPPVRSRFADRNLDLPIEVAENERRLHNDARRFARLLVSEIKLYNEQKVKEGRESSDLYERLREAIDRSREMYDKRVQPPVAAKFDYFNYELVNTLAEGDEGKLGGSYPGPAI